MDKKLIRIAQLYIRGIYTYSETLKAISETLKDIYNFECDLGVADGVLEYFIAKVRGEV